MSTKETTLNHQLSENVELTNGRLAMIGIVAALGAYVTTGNVIPGIF